jgi:hypothetical protein
MAPASGGDDQDIPAPAVPEGRLGDWERAESTVETLFELSAASVRGHTLVYEDAPLRASVREATDGRLDQPWRFFFATRLTFRPPLPPGVGQTMVLPTVRSEAERSFLDDLRDREFEDLDRGGHERIRIRSGPRARLRKVTGRFHLDAVDRDLPVEGWVGVWTDGDIHVAGGAYPATSLASLFDADDDRLATDPGTYRSELLDLIRSVG